MTDVLDVETEPRLKATSEPRIRTAIAVLVSRFPRLDETFILREINELERQGQPVVLVPMLRGGDKIIHEEARPWLRRALYLPLLSLPILASNLRALAAMPLRYLQLLFILIAGTCIRPRTLVRTLALFPKGVHLARILPGFGVKHVHAHFATHSTTLAFIIASLSDLTYSFTVHGPDVFVHRLLLRRKIGKAKFVRAISMFNKAFLSGLYPDIASDRIEVAHMGLDPLVYSRAAAESPHDPDAPLRILSVATLLPNKGFMFLIEACAQLIREGKRVECRIVGDGPRRPIVQEWIDKHGLSESVFLVGAVPQNEVARLMGECDVFVLPSIIAINGQMDGIPMSLIEAMAAGRAVVASSISGIPELVTNGVSGVLVDATHPTRIAQSLRMLLDPELRERLGRAAQAKVRAEFDVRRTAARVIDLFDRAGEPQHDHAAEIAAMTWPDARFTAMGVRRVHARRDSLIAEVTVSDGRTKREMVIKQQRSRAGESRPARARAQHELGVMKLLRDVLAQRSGDIVFSVPEVESFDESHAALLLARAHGTALDVAIRNARNRGHAVSRLSLPLRRAGAWLRAMHESTRIDEDGRHLLTAITVLAMQDLDLAAAADRRLRREHDAIIDKLRRLEARVAEQSLPVVGHHGDYWPGNVFTGDRRVEVIDFEGFREGLPLEDVAYFLVMLELPFSWPFFRRPLPRLKQSFLDGYLGADLPLDRDALRLFTAVKALQILARGGAAARGGWRAAWVRRVLVDLVRRSLA
ncbi:MAG TPA: glycosyltransferase [Thermoanaerobaculia bacterium]|nr:glycosyltransferase [Thermoanaerobaculia bacterium]